MILYQWYSMGTSYKTIQTMKAFAVNLKLFSTMQHWSLLGQFGEQLGLESIISTKWFKHLCCFHKIKTFGLPFYLSTLISSVVHSYNTLDSEDVVTYHCRTGTFKYSFFPWAILEWNKLDWITLHKTSYKIFINYLLKMMYP